MKNFTHLFMNLKSNCKSLTFALFLLVGMVGSVSGQSFRTPTFTGAIGDFNTAERFAAAANNTTYAITFDATYIYIGAFRTSGTFGASDNFAIYIDTDPRNTLATGNGTTAGRAFNGVTPTLAFNADYTSYTEQSYTDPLSRYNGSWASTGVTPSSFTSNTSREVRIALADIGNPASVYISVFMGYAGGIYSSAPGTDVAASSTPNMTGYFGSFPVYKAGITPVSFRAQNTSAANGGGTVIPNFTTGSINGDYGDMIIASGTTNTLTGNSSFSGTLTLSTGGTSRVDLGTATGYTLNAGGRGIGGSAGTVTIGSTSGNPIYSSGAATGATLNFLGSGLINGTSVAGSGSTRAIGSSNVAYPVTVIANGALDFGGLSGSSTATLLLNSTRFQINSGGSVTGTAPSYAIGSSLVYNTGGTYGANTEWTSNLATGVGVPNIVTIQNSTAVNFGVSANYRQANGLVTIGSGSSLTLSSAAGGDLRVAGGLANSNAASGVGFNTNGRALQTMGTGTYTKNGVTGGTDNLDFLIIGSANQFNIADKTNLNLTNTNATGCLQFNANGPIFMLGTTTISIAAGGTVGGTSIGGIGGSGATTSILNLLGTTTWNPGGVVTSSTGVGIQVNSGLSISTAGRLSAGYLQINPGGFVGGSNPVVYPASSTLVYNHSSGTYGVGANEWPAALGPYNVTVNANGASTGISFANNNIGARIVPFAGTSGTLTINQDIDLSGGGTPSLTILGTTALTGGLVANATATVKGTGAFTLGTGANFTTANASGIDGTITSTTKNFAFSNNIFAFNGVVSQATGTLLPATIAQLIINNPTASTGTTISNNALTVSGITTLTAGALVLPTSPGNLVTFTGNIAGVTGTLTGSSTSNITTTGSLNGTYNLTFTTGGKALNNWTKGTATFGGSTPQGLASIVDISGTFTHPGAGDFWTTSTGGLNFLTGSTYDQQANGWYQGTGIITINSGANCKIFDSGGLNATALAGAVRNSGTRTFSGGANYTFNNSATQSIGNALDATGGAGQTGVITGLVNITGGSGQNLTLNTGTTITINSPGSFNMGVLATSGTTVTAPATSVINGSGNVNMFGNGAINGATLITANSNGVNGTFAGTGTFSLNNAGNNSTNFTFNGSAAQVTGTLLPAIVNNLSFANTFSNSGNGSINLSSSVTSNGILTIAGGAAPLGLVGIGASNTLTANGQIILTNASKLIGTATSNLIIGGTGTITGSNLFATSGGLLNDFTMNRASTTVTIGQPLTVSGTYSSTAGVISMVTNALNLNGPIAFGAGTLTSTGSFSIGGTGTITGSLLGTANPLALTGITMNRSSATLPLGSNVSVSNAPGITFTSGNIDLGGFNLTSTNSAGNLGSGSSSSMLVATGTGQAFTSFPTGASTKIIPIGDGTNYSPVTLAFTANAVIGTVGAKVKATTHPQYDNSGTQTDYLSRYWSFTSTGLTTYTYTSTFGYVTGDINGTESNIKLNRWSGTLWTEDATSTASSNVLTSTSGLTNSTFPLNGMDYTGRKETASSSYTWNGSVSNDWATPANWTPSGTPGTLDNVLINVTGSFTNCSINSGSKTVANLTLNGTGALAMAASTTLTVNGNLTYGGTATVAFDCGSTLNIASAAAQTIPALNYGNLNLTGGNRTLSSTGTIGICGTFTPGAGTITSTGSTVNYNGTASQTIAATNYNNLTSSSSGARTLAGSGTIGVAGVFTPGSNAYTSTGSTINYNGTSAQTITAFPSYNNLTISGARASTTVTLASGTIGVAGTFTPSATSVTYVSTGNTFDYTAATSQTIAGFDRYNNLSNTGNGTRTLANTPTIVIDGVYTSTSGTVTVGSSTIDFSSASAQTMPATFYGSITNTGNGARTWASSGIIDIFASFTPTTATNTITGSTIRYSATSASTFTMSSFTTNVINRQYNNLILVGGASTIWQPASGFNLGVVGDFSLTGSGTLNICSNATPNAMNVDGNFTIGTSSGKLNVTSSSGNGTLNVAGNFLQSGTGTITISGGTGLGTANISGNLTISSGIINGNAATTTSKDSNIIVGGSYLQTGGTLNLQNNISPSGSTYGFLQVDGNYTLTSGTFEFASSGVSLSSTNLGELDIKGDFIRNGTSNSLKATGGNYNGLIYFIGTTPQNINVTTTTATTNFIEIAIISGSTVSLLSNLKSSALTVDSGGTLFCGSNFVQDGNTVCDFINNGTLGIGSANGIVSGTSLSGNIQSTGLRTFATTGNYIYNGVAPQVTGSGIPATLNNLTINNSGGNVKLTKSLNVNGNVTMTSGNLDLNGSFNITLGSSSSIVNETNTKRILNTGSPTAGNGFVGGIFTLGANPGNVANLGMNFTAASAMGTTILQRFPKAVSGIPTGLTSISRVYSITSTNAATNTAVSYTYFDNELNGNTETPVLVPYLSTNSNETLGANYAFTPATASDGTSNTVSQTYNIPAGGTNFVTLLNSSEYYTIADGDWNDTATWLGNVVPPNAANATVFHTVTVNNSVTPAPNRVVISTGGSLTFGSSGNLTVNGSLVNGASGINMTAGGTINIGNNGTFTNGTTAFVGGTGTVVLSGVGTVTGTVTFNNLTLNGGTSLTINITIDGNLTFNANTFLSSNSPSYSSNSTLVYNTGGTFNRNSEFGSLSGPGYPNNVLIQGGTMLDLSANGFADRKIGGNLILGIAGSGSTGSLTMGTSDKKFTVSGNVSIGGTTTGSNILTLSSVIGGDLYVQGNWIKNTNGTFTPNGRAVFFNGASAQTLTGATTFDYLRMSQTTNSTLTLNNNINITNDIVFGTGKIVTGTNTVVMNSTATASSGENANSYIAGGQQWDFNVATSHFYSVGDASVYAGVNIDYTIIGASGALKIVTTSGDQANIATSTLDANKSVNRTYTLTTPNGLSGTYNGIFGFATSDLDVSTDTSKLLVGNYVAGSWSYPLIGTRNLNNTQATGITALGAFQLAECRNVVLVITDPAEVCSGSTVDLTAAAVTTGSTPAGQLTFTYFTDLAATTSLATPAAVAASGTYYIKATSNTGCTAIQSVLVTITPASVGGTLSNANQTICAATTPAVIILSGNTGTVIKWQKANNSGFTGATDISNTTNSLILSPVSVTTYYRAVVQSGSCTVVNSSTAVININTATYDAALYAANTPANWSEAPSNAKSIVINSDYMSAGDLEGCSCMINPGVTVTFTTGTSLILNEGLTTSGATLILQDGAQLIQIADIDNATANTNVGSIQMTRITKPLFRYDYTYWGSAMWGNGDGIADTGEFTLNNLSPGTLADKYFSWNGAWTMHYGGNVEMLAGKGYIVRAPQSYNISGTGPSQTYTATLTGKPNNGIIYTPIAAGDWNLLSNPYPSAMSAQTFLTVNPDLDGTLYFWTHNTTVSATTSLQYAPDDYAAWNSTGGAATYPAPSGSTGGVNNNQPDGSIAAGQAFFVKGGASGVNAQFNNTMRNAAYSNSQFFKPSITQPVENWEMTGKHRVWLNLKGETKGFNQILVGYIQNATNEYDDRYDGPSFGGNFVTFYSILGTDNLVIQGRALPFTNTDTVPLGYNTTLNGNLTISIDQVDGLMEGQNIYLQDNVLNLVHDLKESDYTFASVAGTFDNRFVLRYLPEETLDNPTFDDQMKGVTIRKNNADLHINSPYETIDTVYVFDIMGRLVFEKKDCNSNTVDASYIVYSDQTLIVKVKLSNGGVVTQKVF